MTVQSLRNGAMRLTFKSSAECERVLASGIRYGDDPLRLAPAGTRISLSKNVPGGFQTLDGPCRRCHQPGYQARFCRNA